MQLFNHTHRAKLLGTILVGLYLPLNGWTGEVLMEDEPPLVKEKKTLMESAPIVEEAPPLMEEVPLMEEPPLLMEDDGETENPSLLEKGETLLETGKNTLLEGGSTLMEKGKVLMREGQNALSDDGKSLLEKGKTLLEKGQNALSSNESPLSNILAPFTSTDANTHTQIDEIVCKNNDVCRQKATSLPLRALPRPFSTLYSGADTTSTVFSSNVKAFWPMYVFARKDLDLSDPVKPKGWYQVGSMVNDPIGWMQAKDILEWKQTLVVSYTHPGTGDERRNSVLMFDTKAALQNIVEADEREIMVQKMYADLAQQPPQIPHNVISREPARFVNIEEKFYLLPVIDFEQIDLFDDETRYLQLAAAIPQSRADEANPDTLTNRNFAEQAAKTETVAGTQAKTLGLDIKFVMDMTGSMGPFIKRTKEAIAKVATQIAHKNIATQVRYGLIGYRDDLVTVPGLKFVTQNFTPNTLVTVDEFDDVIAKASPATDKSGDYQEEPFAGINEALNSAWNNNALKFIILVGDASSHPVGHPQNTTGLDAIQLRQLANSQKVNIISIHLKASRFQADHALAEKQFTQLADNPGSELPAYMAVAAHNHEDFEIIVKSVAEALSIVVGKVRQGNVEIVKQAPDTTAIEETQEISAKAGKIAEATAATALVDYLGNAANPPRDITTWVIDRDLTDTAIRALQVRVLLKKRELNDLIQALETVLKAVKRSQLTSMQFFDALQGVVTQTTKSDQQITFEAAKRLAESGLMPAWINSLPYKSAILEMSNELFEALSAGERANLEYEIEAKLQLYREINENSDLWVALDERDASINHVYPLSLTALP
jgi:hypothetical protein